ncbi:hypothetical protein FOMG_19570 [Fusarium oxysporum f. sp. melonis 26406]|uniref:Uncharacterized protein n=1 Tax=Fusarium oxysporum f. sp. melonis 26406 TaxID=1089452 RepID=W9YWX9_FUSOX|nr:hypothetical protein FOMG_19570 [Fusarium oxysporum f. sp. melonis 26406]
MGLPYSYSPNNRVVYNPDSYGPCSMYANSSCLGQCYRREMYSKPTEIMVHPRSCSHHLGLYYNNNAASSYMETSSPLFAESYSF